jgi:hypothetical protein
MRELGLTSEADIADQLGLSFEGFPIPDRGVPASVEATKALWGVSRQRSAAAAPWAASSRCARHSGTRHDEQRLWLARAFRREGRQPNLAVRS